MTRSTKRIEVMRQGWGDVPAVPSRWVPLWAWRWQQPGDEGHRGVSLKVGPLLVILGTHYA
jgi:hypothetical protein